MPLIATPTPPAGGSTGGSPASIVARIKLFMAGWQPIEAMLCNLPQGTTLSPEMEAEVQAVRAVMSRLSRTCADMMELAADLFTGFDFTADDLRADEEESRGGDEIIEFLTAAQARLEAYFDARKARMATRTMKVVNQVKALRAMPVLDAKTQAEVNTVWPPINTVLTEANQAVQDVKKTHVGLKETGAAAVAAVQAQSNASGLELKVLRGNSLSTQDVQQAAAPIAAAKSHKVAAGGAAAAPKSKTTAKGKKKKKAPKAPTT